MKIGDTVENFQLFDQYNKKFDLYENLNTEVLLVFYPKDNSPVCTKQLVDYSLNQDELKKIGIKTVGINIEPPESHLNFCQNNKIEFPVLSDVDKKISTSYDALNILGQNKRKLVLIGKDKKVKLIKTTFPIFFVDSRKLLLEIKKNTTDIKT